MVRERHGELLATLPCGFLIVEVTSLIPFNTNMCEKKYQYIHIHFHVYNVLGVDIGLTNHFQILLRYILMFCY